MLLVVAAFIVGGESPEADDSLREVTSYYSDNHTDVQIASALLALGAFFFLLFSTTLTGVLRRDGQGGVSSSFGLGGGIVFAVGATIFAGLGFATADVVNDIAPGGVQALNALSSDRFFTVLIGTAAFLLGAGVAIRSSRAVPAWLGWAAIALGVIAMTPGGFFAFLGLGIWILIVSVLLAGQAGTAPAGGAAAGPVP